MIGNGKATGVCLDREPWYGSACKQIGASCEVLKKAWEEGSEAVRGQFGLTLAPFETTPAP